MFEKLLGLPAHPLLLHAAVIFGPLLVVTVFVYALVPVTRKRLGWLVVLLAIAAPAMLWFARLSGEEMFEQMVAKKYGAELLAKVDTHGEFGEIASWVGLAVGVLALVLVLVCTAAGKKPATPGSRALTYSVVLLSVVGAAVLGYYIYKTGHSGATAVWDQFYQS